MGSALCALRFGLGVEHGLSLFSRVYAWYESKEPLGIMICMRVVLLFLGCFIDPVSIMMVTVPIFMPIIKTLDLNLVWFGLIFLINLDVGFLTPPFGMTLFVMKGCPHPVPQRQTFIERLSPFS